MRRVLGMVEVGGRIPEGAVFDHFYRREPAVTRQVTGMVCEGCVEHVQTSLAAVPGVTDVDVSLAKQRATIHYQGDQQPQHDALVKAVEEAGYQAQ